MESRLQWNWFAGVAMCGWALFSLSPALAVDELPATGSRPKRAKAVEKRDAEPDAQDAVGGPFVWHPFELFFGRKPVAKITRPPFPELEPAPAQLRDQILGNWERASRPLDRLYIKFQRWEYDPTFGPRDAHSTYATGFCKYEKPNSWSYNEERLLHYIPPKSKDESPKYGASEDEHGAHWGCDGKSLFHFDHARKQVIELELPPDDRERLLPFGFLPFFVNVKTDNLKKHFWIRVITPQDAADVEWLELCPKSNRESFQKLELILDKKDWLPKAIQVFHLGYDERTNPARNVFMFSDRRTNRDFAEPICVCFQSSPFRLPKGWERIVEKYPSRETEDPAPTKKED